jgi:hypothetical protein
MTTLLTFDSKIAVYDSTAFTSSSTTLADDTRASPVNHAELTFTLAGSRTVLAFYVGNSTYAANSPPIKGFKTAVNVDGTDYSTMSDSGNYGTYAQCMRTCCVWCGTLAAGQHTIKGRFASNAAGVTATLNNRSLVIYIFNGDSFYYIDNNTNSITSSVQTLADDTYASLSVNPPANCTAIALYAQSNPEGGATQRYDGTKTGLYIGNADVASTENSDSTYGTSSDVNHADSSCTVWVGTINSGSATAVKGRFAKITTASGVQANIGSRSIAVLCIDPANVTVDPVVTTTQISTASTTLADDANVSVSRSFDGELLVLGLAYKKSGTSGYMYGLCYGLEVDNVDVVNCRASPNASTVTESVFLAYAKTVAAGAHTIQGRFAVNAGTGTQRYDNRTFYALWFNTLTLLNTSTNCTGQGVATATNRTLDQLNTNCTGQGQATATNNLLVKLPTSTNCTGQGVATAANRTLLSTSTNCTGQGVATATNRTLLTTSTNCTGSGTATASNVTNSLLLTSTNCTGQGVATAANNTKLTTSTNCTGQGTATAANMTFVMRSTSCTGQGVATAANCINLTSSTNCTGSGSSTARNMTLLPESTNCTGQGQATANNVLSESLPTSTNCTGVGSATANARVLCQLSATATGQGQATAGDVLIKNLSATATGQGVATANGRVLLITSSSVSGVGVATANDVLNTPILNTSTYCTGEGVATAADVLLKFLNTNCSGQGSAEAIIRLYDMISTSATGEGRATAGNNILLTTSANATGRGVALADPMTFNNISTEATGEGRADATLFGTHFLSTYCIGVGIATAENETLYKRVMFVSPLDIEVEKRVREARCTNPVYNHDLIIQKTGRDVSEIENTERNVSNIQKTTRDVVFS